MLTIFLLAVSLALDAFAVSVCSGISVPGFRKRQAVKMGLFFGAFQFLMPLIGWFLGTSVAEYIEAYDHFIAFGLLAFIGARMIHEALRESGEDAPAPPALTVGRLTVLALATSIDALAVGVSLAFMEVDIFLAAAVIGAVAFVLSVIGGLAGRRLGALFQKRAAMVGGLVLIAVGVKILAEHLIQGI